MEQAANRTEAASADHYFPLPTENISVPVCLWTWTDDCFVMHSRSPSRGHNTNKVSLHVR